MNSIFVRWFYFFLLLSIPSWLRQFNPGLTQSQVAPEWDVPIELSQNQVGETDILADSPILRADNFGGLHLLYKSQNAIFYMRKIDGNWSKPIDILVTPGIEGTIESYDFGIDPTGMIHVVWLGSSQIASNRIYYSHAQYSEAFTAHGWEPPKVLFILDSNPFTVPFSFKINSDGILHLLAVFPLGTNFELFHTSSQNKGASWSDPIEISFSKEKMRPGYPRLEIGTDDVLHAVWSEFNEELPLTKRNIFYAHSANGGQTWSSPFELAEDGNYNFPSVAELSSAERIITVWEGSAPNIGRWYRLSTDGGNTWYGKDRIAEFTGLTGSPQLIRDSSEISHFIGSADGLGQIAGLFHWSFSESGWSGPTQIDKDISGEYPCAAITNGNRLHLVWTGIGYAKPGIWYTSLKINAPETKLAPQLSSIIETPDIVVVAPTITAIAINSSKKIPDEVKSTSEPNLHQFSSSVSPISPIYYGVFAAILVIAMTGVQTFWKNHKK